ncbi:MAG: M23 family metallopeptidase, partial [Candidatus Brocadiaceae bacterium]|nr:M23 family metallopeptidase [Candidatus Brocadiaceae bacterium]
MKKGSYLVIIFLAALLIYEGEVTASQVLFPSPQLPDGSLVKGSQPMVYVVEKGQRRAIPDPATFKAMNYPWGAIWQVSDDVLQRIPEGQPLQSVRGGIQPPPTPVGEPGGQLLPPSKDQTSLPPKTHEVESHSPSLPAIPPLLLPVKDYDRISLKFGDPGPPGVIYAGTGNLHNGIDFACVVGMPVFACDKGEVIETEYDEQKGNYIRIGHDWGKSVYLHLREKPNKKGNVARG